jgi:hypothetical protein
MAKAKSGDNKELNRMDMVREALQDLGESAKPLAIQAHIKDKHGEEIPTNIISNYKFQIKAKGGGTGAARGRRKTTTGSLSVEDFVAIRGLVSRLGAEQVKQLVDVVG